MADPSITPPAGVDADQWGQALAAARRYCGWHVTPVTTQTFTVDGPGGPLLILPTLNLTEVTEVIEDGAPVSDIDWSAAGMLRKRSGYSWTNRYRGIVATVMHGYESAEDFESVVKAMVDRLSIGAIQSTVGAVSMTYAPDLLETEKRTLAAYKLSSRP